MVLKDELYNNLTLYFEVIMNFDGTWNKMKIDPSECIICHRPLTTPESVEAGIGPECRRKNHYVSECREWTKKAACAAESKDWDLLFNYADEIEKMGYKKFADKVRAKYTVVSIEWDGDHTYYMKVPFSEHFNMIRRERGYRKMIWNPKDAVLSNGDPHPHRKTWEFDSVNKGLVVSMIKEVWSGQMASGPKGLFQM